MKTITKYSLLALFLLGSMYYTNKVIITMRTNDPIMIQITNNKDKYEILPVDAIIEEETIIPGLNGVVVDQMKSYQKMKKYGSYNESLTVLKEEQPTTSVKDYYDKYIEKGNPSKREISLVFKINPTK